MSRVRYLTSRQSGEHHTTAARALTGTVIDTIPFDDVPNPGDILVQHVNDTDWVRSDSGLGQSFVSLWRRTGTGEMSRLSRQRLFPTFGSQHDYPVWARRRGTGQMVVFTGQGPLETESWQYRTVTVDGDTITVGTLRTISPDYPAGYPAGIVEAVVERCGAAYLDDGTVLFVGGFTLVIFGLDPQEQNDAGLRVLWLYYARIDPATGTTLWSDQLPAGEFIDENDPGWVLVDPPEDFGTLGFWNDGIEWGGDAGLFTCYYLNEGTRIGAAVDHAVAVWVDADGGVTRASFPLPANEGHTGSTTDWEIENLNLLTERSAWVYGVRTRRPDPEFGNYQSSYLVTDGLVQMVQPSFALSDFEGELEAFSSGYIVGDGSFYAIENEAGPDFGFLTFSRYDGRFMTVPFAITAPGDIPSSPVEYSVAVSEDPWPKESNPDEVFFAPQRWGYWWFDQTLFYSQQTEGVGGPGPFEFHHLTARPGVVLGQAGWQVGRGGLIRPSPRDLVGSGGIHFIPPPETGYT